MKTSNNLKALIFSSLCIASLAISETAQATWMFSHGNVAQIEYLNNVSSYHYKGWGLDFEHKPGFSNWIHLTVPTEFDPKSSTQGARYIILKFKTYSVDAWVADIHIYNGNVKVKEFAGLTYSNGQKNVKLDLGKKMKFSRGLGISIKTKAGVELMSHRFIFSGAGANFVD